VCSTLPDAPMEKEAEKGTARRRTVDKLYVALSNVRSTLIHLLGSAKGHPPLSTSKIRVAKSALISSLVSFLIDDSPEICRRWMLMTGWAIFSCSSTVSDVMTAYSGNLLALNLGMNKVVDPGIG